MRFNVTYVPYKFEWLLKDFVAGITLLTILIPQSMAYSILAGLSPVVGLYSSLAVFPFAFFASNPTCTIGPFTVTQILMRNVRPIYLSSLIGGLMQVIISPFSSMISVWLFPKTFMSGFTTGCAFLIAAAQIDDFFGISLIKPDQFTVILKFVDMFRKLQDTHLLTFLVGLCSLLAIYLLKKLNSWFKTVPRLSKIWVPDIFVACLLATLVSYFLDFKNKGVHVVGAIPQGFPNFIPPWSYDDVKNINWASLVLETLPIAIVSSSITLSVLTQYNTPSTIISRDMFLTGMSSIAISFFQGFLATGSLTRSALQKEVGALTQISNVVLSVLLILVLISIASVFEPVPMPTLAAIVILAAKSLLKQLHTVGWPLIKAAWKHYHQVVDDIELEVDDPKTIQEDEVVPMIDLQSSSLSAEIGLYEQHPIIQALYFWVPCFGIFFFNVQVTLAFCGVCVILWKAGYATKHWYINKEYGILQYQ